MEISPDNDPTDWLLESDNPSVRYFTLRDILERQEDDSELRDAKQAIMESGPVPAILEKQDKSGCWDDAKTFYTAKYRGTVWQLIILASLGADGNDGRIRAACEFLLDHSQDPESGGYRRERQAEQMGHPERAQSFKKILWVRLSGVIAFTSNCICNGRSVKA